MRKKKAMIKIIFLSTPTPKGGRPQFGWGEENDAIYGSRPKRLIMT
jgi:hypothetical protein